MEVCVWRDARKVRAMKNGFIAEFVMWNDMGRVRLGRIVSRSGFQDKPGVAMDGFLECQELYNMD